MIKKVLSFGKYVVVAAGAALTDWITFIILDFMGINFLICQMSSRITGGVFSFTLNRVWSFQYSRHGVLQVQAQRFLVLYVASYGLSIGFMFTFVDQLNIDIYLAKLATDLACFVLNFFVMQEYVFHRRFSFIQRIYNRISPNV